MNSATSASAVRLERYARDRRTASSLASPGVVSRTPGGSSARIASCTASGSRARRRAAGRRDRAGRVGRAATARCRCRACRAAGGTRRPAAARRPAAGPRRAPPARRACRRRRVRSICAAAGLSQTSVLAEQSVALRGGGARSGERRLQLRRPERIDADQLRACGRGPAVAPAPRSPGSPRRCPGSPRAVGYSASSKPSPGACTDRSAMPNRLREASCTSSAATRLIR